MIFKQTLMALVAVLMVACVSPAFAGPDVELTWNTNFYDENAQESEAYTLKLGWDDMPLYVWGSTEDGVMARDFGQPLGRSDLLSYGFGFRQRSGNWTTFIEIGVVDVSFQQIDNVVGEMVDRELMTRHNFEGRETPWEPGDLNWWWKEPQGKEPDGYATWEMSDFYVGKVGLSYDWNHMIITAAYRYGKGDEEFWGWSNWERGSERPVIGDPDSDRCGCAWMETRSRNWSAFEIGFGFKW